MTFLETIPACIFADSFIAINNVTVNVMSCNTRRNLHEILLSSFVPFLALSVRVKPFLFQLNTLSHVSPKK